MANKLNKMKLTFYDILFFSIYNVMMRQGNKNPKDDRIDGLFGGAIFISLIPFFIYMDLVMFLKHFNPIQLLPSKGIVIIILVSLMLINFIFFKTKNRYLAIHTCFDSMIKKQRKQALISAWSFMSLLIIVFFFFAFTRFKTY
jgi:hypothetical protein